MAFEMSWVAILEAKMGGLRKDENNATSKAILYSWMCVAYNAPLP
jgi:hypothetical protein